MEEQWRSGRKHWRSRGGVDGRRREAVERSRGEESSSSGGAGWRRGGGAEESRGLAEGRRGGADEQRETEGDQLRRVCREQGRSGREAEQEQLSSGAGAEGSRVGA